MINTKKQKRVPRRQADNISLFSLNKKKTIVSFTRAGHVNTTTWRSYREVLSSISPKGEHDDSNRSA